MDQNQQAAENTPAVVFEGHGFQILRRRDKPEKRIKLALPRDPIRVDDNVQDAFGGLCRGQARWPLFLHGDTGTGKTIAAICMVDVLYGCMWTDLDSLCELLVTHGSWKHIEESEAAVLDEIGGRDNVTSVDADAVKKFLDIRECNCNRVGIYVSNHSPDAIRQLYRKRIASRLLCGTVVETTGIDQRKAMD